MKRMGSHLNGALRGQIPDRLHLKDILNMRITKGLIRAKFKRQALLNLQIPNTVLNPKKSVNNKCKS